MSKNSMAVSRSIPQFGPRPTWKTFWVTFLLVLIPVVGWSMATMYVITRDDQEQYNAGKAALAGLIVSMIIIVGILALYAAAIALGWIFPGLYRT